MGAIGGRGVRICQPKQPTLAYAKVTCARCARGIGEIGITGVAGALANAVYHATGRRIRDVPITLDKLIEL